MPFSTTRVIHADWSKHHQPVAEGAMTAVCRIETPGVGPGSTDPGTESKIPAAPIVIIDDCPCRIQEIDSATEATQAGQQVTERRYLIPVPADVPDVPEGAHIVITAADNDAHLVGRRLQVTDVQYGSERFERDLIATDNLD